jgi:hypothetical protein
VITYRSIYWRLRERILAEQIVILWKKIPKFSSFIF